VNERGILGVVFFTSTADGNQMELGQKSCSWMRECIKVLLTPGTFYNAVFMMDMTSLTGEAIALAVTLGKIAYFSGLNTIGNICNYVSTQLNKIFQEVQVVFRFNSKNCFNVLI